MSTPNIGAMLEEANSGLETQRYDLGYNINERAGPLNRLQTAQAVAEGLIIAHEVLKKNGRL